MSSSKYRALILAACGCPLVALGQTTPALTLAQVQQAVLQLDSFAADGMSRTGVPGMAVAVVFRDQMFFLNYGVRKSGENTPIDSDTVFQLASVSKSITSTAIAKLVDEGYVSWDDRISVLDPAFQLSDPLSTQQVTVRDLISHRSGLPEFAGDVLEDLGFNRQQILTGLRFLTPLASLRSKYAYTNFGVTEAATAVAREYGENWEDLLSSQLFVPLGMLSSSARYSDYVKASNKATLHVPGPGGMVPKYQRDADAQAPAGGISSTASDLARWLSMHLQKGTFEGQQVISSAALEETYKPEAITSYDPATGRTGTYALGWDVTWSAGKRRISHSGAFARGAATSVSFYPDDQVGVVVLTNAFPVGLAEGMSSIVLDLLYNDAATVRSKDWVGAWSAAFAAFIAEAQAGVINYASLPVPVHPSGSSLPMSGMLGTYTSPYFGDLQISYTGNAYFMTLGPNQTKYQLGYWDKNTFVYYFDAESGTGWRGVSFRTPVNNHFTQVTVENLKAEAGGLFTYVPPAR